MNKWFMFFFRSLLFCAVILAYHSCVPPVAPDNISKNLKWYSPLWPPTVPTLWLRNAPNTVCFSACTASIKNYLSLYHDSFMVLNPHKLSIGLESSSWLSRHRETPYRSPLIEALDPRKDPSSGCVGCVRILCSPNNVLFPAHFLLLFIIYSSSHFRFF